MISGRLVVRFLSIGSLAMAPRQSARIKMQKETATDAVTALKAKNETSSNGVGKKRKNISKDSAKKTARKTGGLAKPEPRPSRRASNGPAVNDTLRVPVTPPPLDRPVEPHRTNATLVTPRGTSVVTYPPGAEDASPSKTGLPYPTATTGNLLEKAEAHLIATEPRLKPLIDKYPCRMFSPEGLAEQVDPFQSLASSIIGQQVSGPAASSIKKKFLTLFSSDEPDETGWFPTPAEVARCDITTLRTAGLSQRKAEYIQGLAERFVSGELSTQMLLKASDEEIFEKLIAVRGLGRWSVEMFSCFGLKRTDVFSTGDLGVQKGCATLMGHDVNKLKGKGDRKFKYMHEKDMLEMAERFRPYRSLFMWYMWRVEDVDITALSN